MPLIYTNECIRDEICRPVSMTATSVCRASKLEKALAKLVWMQSVLKMVDSNAEDIKDSD